MIIYEIYVIKTSVSPEKRKMDFSNYYQELKVFPNFMCIYGKVKVSTIWKGTRRQSSPDFETQL